MTFYLSKCLRNISFQRINLNDDTSIVFDVFRIVFVGIKIPNMILAVYVCVIDFGVLDWNTPSLCVFVLFSGGSGFLFYLVKPKFINSISHRNMNLVRMKKKFPLSLANGKITVPMDYPIIVSHSKQNKKKTS